MTALSSAARRDPMVAGESVARAAVTFAGCFIAVLTFGLSFGKVWALGIRLGVLAWVAPLVGPSVDLSVVGLLIGLRHLATHGADRRQLRPARLLLLFSCATTLALNAAEPILAGRLGQAAFDSVGPLLLIGWSEVGPGLLEAIIRAGIEPQPDAGGDQQRDQRQAPLPAGRPPTLRGVRSAIAVDSLLERARMLHVQHQRQYGRPISADALRQHLRIGSARARALASLLRSEAAGSGTAAW
jgi:Protein of unknown function (DUF2637)